MTHFPRSILLARQAFEKGEIPVGAVITRENEVIAEAHNLSHEPTAHAEMLAIRKACEVLGQPRLEDCDLYVTLEPCPMCAQAISFARIRRLYFGAYDQKGGGEWIFGQKSCFHKPEIYGGIEESACAKLLRDFFESRR